MSIPVRLRLRKLPFNARPSHVRAFFEGYQLAENHPAGPIDFLRSYDKKPTGQCFVYFTDENEAMRAHDELHDTLWIKTSSALVGRIDVIEDWSIGRRHTVKEEYVPGDITDDRLKDEARELMLERGHIERERREEMEKPSQWFTK